MNTPIPIQIANAEAKLKELYDHHSLLIELGNETKESWIKEEILARIDSQNIDIKAVELKIRKLKGQ
jgi:hypothetical protein